MSDQQKLSAVVTALRKDAAARGRTLSAENADMLLAGLLAECDATVLPRQLSFTNESNAELQVILANRRMFSAAKLGSKAASYDDLSLEDKKQISGLRKTLNEFVSRSKTLTIRSQGSEQSVGAGRVGIPIATLATLWDIDTDAVFEPKQHGGAEVFAEIIQPHVSSCVIVENGDVVLSFGEADPAEKLAQFARTRFDDLIAALDANFEMGSATKRIAVLAEHPQDGTALVCAQAHSSTLLAVVKSATVANVMSDWQNF